MQNNIVEELKFLKKEYEDMQRICECDLYFSKRGVNKNQYFQVLGSYNSYVRVVTDLELLIEKIEKGEIEND